MPWVAEKKIDDERKLKSQQQAATSGKRSAKAQKSISSFFKPKSASKKGAANHCDTDGDVTMRDEDGTEKSSGQKGAAGACDDDEKLALLSKVVESDSVETFDWKYTEREYVNGNLTKKIVTKKLENLQAILINPKWAEHGLDTLATTTTASQNSSQVASEDCDL